MPSFSLPPVSNSWNVHANRFWQEHCPSLKSLNLDAQAAGNEVTLVQQENALAFSILQLKQALQIPASEPLDVEIPALEPEDLVIERNAG